MKSIFFGLALASVASAQSVLGVSMVTLDASSATSTDASSSSAYYGSAAPAQYTGATSSSAYVPPSMYTQPPSTQTAAATDVMPYSSFTAGGYSSMNCGYGYAKGSDGSCQMQSWVCDFFDIFKRLQIDKLNEFQYSFSGCYETIIINQ